MNKAFIWFSASVFLAVSFLTGCNVEIQSNGQISIQSEPAQAEIYVNGNLQGKTPKVLSGLAGGNYLVELRKEGYVKTYDNITLLEGQRREVKQKLQPVSGLLLVDSNPQGAHVFIGELSKGRTPLLLHDLPIGNYKIDFKSEGELPRSIEVEIKGRTPQYAFTELIPNTARLTVHSVPEGAEVRINGIKYGVTPETFDNVPAGETEIKVSRRGYKPYLTTMRLEATKPYEVGAELEALPSGLTIVSEPPGASITVDNKPVGIAPLTLTNLSDGMHEVIADLDGFDTKTKTIFLEPDINDSIEFNMKKNSGVLVLDTEPANVQVYLNGKLVTTTVPKSGSDSISQPVRLTLKSGRAHSLQLVREGFTHLNTTVTAELDQVVTRHEVLKRIFVYDTQITTEKEIIKCRFEYKLPNGDIYYERFPGVFDTAKAGDIRDVQPITLDDESNRAARRLIEQSRQSVPKNP